jgi:cytidine deaminase
VVDFEPLIAAASEAREKAYTPYSSFAVGSALLMDDGEIFAGCNIENRSFSVTICAERSALAAAVSQGKRKLRAAVVLTDTNPPSAPCGACREVLYEFADGEVPVLLVNTNGDSLLVQLSDLLPRPFVFPAPS